MTVIDLRDRAVTLISPSTRRAVDLQLVGLEAVRVGPENLEHVLSQPGCVVVDALASGAWSAKVRKALRGRVADVVLLLDEGMAISSSAVDGEGPGLRVVRAPVHASDVAAAVASLQAAAARSAAAQQEVDPSDIEQQATVDGTPADQVPAEPVRAEEVQGTRDARPDDAIADMRSTGGHTGTGADAGGPEKEPVPSSGADVETQGAADPVPAGRVLAHRRGRGVREPRVVRAAFLAADTSDEPEPTREPDPDDDWAATPPPSPPPADRQRSSARATRTPRSQAAPRVTPAPVPASDTQAPPRGRRGPGILARATTALTKPASMLSRTTDPHTPATASTQPKRVDLTKPASAAALVALDSPTAPHGPAVPDAADSAGRPDSARHLGRARRRPGGA